MAAFAIWMFWGAWVTFDWIIHESPWVVRLIETISVKTESWPGTLRGLALVPVFGMAMVVCLYAPVGILSFAAGFQDDSGQKSFGLRLWCGMKELASSSATGLAAGALIHMATLALLFYGGVLEFAMLLLMIWIAGKALLGR